MEIINITPHPILIMDKDNKVIYKIESKWNYRVASSNVYKEDIEGIPVYKSHNLCPPLPIKKEGVIYIASLYVCQVYMDRDDLYIPYQLIKAPNSSRTIWCRALATNPCFNNNK